MRPTWPVDRSRLRRLRIGWPAEYEWAPAGNWVGTILAGLRANGARIERRPIPQPYPTVVVIEVAAGTATHRVVLDYADRPDVNAEAARDSLVYFKMNHLASGYPQQNVVPGGYVAGSRALYRRLRLLRAARGRPRFTYDVYGRFGLRFPSETRRRAFAILSARDDFRYEGSLFRYPGGPDKVPYTKYLREITRSKVCVDMPNGGDLAFRLVDYLAVGACIVRPRRSVLLPDAVTLHVPLVDGEHLAYCAPDLSDLGDVCARLVRDERQRETMARNARDFFDRYLHRRQLAAYYLHEICRAVSA